MLWIGGGTGAGKTSVASAIARRHRTQIYRYDYHDARDHSERIEPACHPNLHRWASMNDDQRWVRTSPEALAASAIDESRERLTMVLDDLQALTAEVPIVAEGFGFYPELIAPVLSDSHHAVWLLPTSAFREAALEARGWSPPPGVSDVTRARSNKLQRDARLTEITRSTAVARGFKTIDVDGTRGLEDIVAEVEHHFRGVLSEYDDRPRPLDAAHDERLRAEIVSVFPRFLAACTRGHAVLERVAQAVGVEPYRLGLLHSGYLAAGRSRVTEDLLRQANPAAAHSRIGAEHWATLIDAGLVQADGTGWLVTDLGFDTMRRLYRETRAEVGCRSVPPALVGRVGEVLERMSFFVPSSLRAVRIRELWGSQDETTLTRLYRAVFELYVVHDADRYVELWPSGEVLVGLRRDLDALLELVSTR